MRVRIAIDFAAEIVTLGSDCVPLSEFILYIDSLQDEKTKRAVKRKLRRITNMYLDSFTKQKRVTPVVEMVKIPRVEYEQMKADIAFLKTELQVVKEENAELRAENAALRVENKLLKERITILEAENKELRRICDKYFALYGPLPPEELN